MSLTKYAECETLSVENAAQTTTKVLRVAHRADFSHIERRPGYIYVRSRAISSRTNDNYDAFPAEEIKKAYATFKGKPVFVNHKNSNHRRARGVIVAVALHEDTNPDGSPDTWAEVLMEVDAVKFPVLAREVEAGNIARTSMGTDVQYSVCTACGNKAYTPVDYCAHIPKMKGMKIRRVNAGTGRSEEVLIAEVCYGLGFFENSLLVEPPADPTAYVLGVEHGDMAKAASLSTEAASCPRCNPDMPLIEARLCRSHNFQQQHGSIDFPSHNHPRTDFAYPTQTGPVRYSAVEALLAEAALKPVSIKASEIQEGDRLDISGKTRVVQRHPRTDRVLVKTQTRGARSPSIKEWAPDEDVRIYREGSMDRLAYGETKAPAKVDTMRAEACPVCGDDEGYSGEQCNVCGYTQPPEQFRDPDLSKAKEMDLRQDQQDAGAVQDPGFTEEVPAAEQQPEDLQCSNCGEVFSAEGDPATDTDAADPNAPPEADPEHPEDPANPDSKKARDPHDLSDLADIPDEELLEDDPKDPKVKKADPNEDPDPSKAPDPAATGEGRVRPDDPEEADQNREDADPIIEANMTCPICGEGTLLPVDPAAQGQEDLDPTPDPAAAPAKPNKVPPKNSSRHRAGDVQKEASTDMPDPNPAQQRRSKIIAAIAEQQKTIEEQHKVLASQHQQIRLLTDAVGTLAVAAGAGSHPKFAAIVRQAGLTHLADSAQNPEGAPATTTEEAKKPQATDDVNSEGAAPGTVNKDVTPAAVTDVQNSNVAVNPPVLDNLQDVTAPVAGTDAVTPAAGDAAGTSTVTVGTPDQKSFDSTGPQWKGSSRGEDKERFVASVRLARLQIEAGVATGEDMVIAQAIDASETSLDAINASIAAIESVRTASTANAQQRERTRSLVPRSAQRPGIQPAGSSPAPSLQTQAQAVTSRPGEDEWGIGADTIE